MYAWCDLFIFKHDTYYLASSEIVSDILQSAMGIEREKIIICGYPKLDKCFNVHKRKSINVLYAPTYRGDYNSELDILSMFGFDMDKADKILKDNDAQLTIRLHPANKLPENITKKIKEKNCIFIDEVEDVYDTLHTYSLVITDFSSIYFDAIAVGINALIAPFGYQEYVNNDRDLYFKISELYPSEMPYDWDAFFNNFTHYISMNNIDFTSIRDKFYSHPFTPSSAHLTNLIYLILYKGSGNE